MDSNDIDPLVDSLAKALGISSDDLREDLAKRRARIANKVASNNARFYAALNAMTDEQTAVVDRHMANGYHVNKVLVDTRSGRTAVLMVKRPVWWPAKGIMGRKLLVVYPDSKSAETFEKSISIRKEF
jgi:hypothetical protein